MLTYQQHLFQQLGFTNRLKTPTMDIGEKKGIDPYHLLKFVQRVKTKDFSLSLNQFYFAI